MEMLWCCPGTNRHRNVNDSGVQHISNFRACVDHVCNIYLCVKFNYRQEYFYDHFSVVSYGKLCADLRTMWRHRLDRFYNVVRTFKLQSAICFRHILTFHQYPPVHMYGLE